MMVRGVGPRQQTEHWFWRLGGYGLSIEQQRGVAGRLNVQEQHPPEAPAALAAARAHRSGQRKALRNTLSGRARVCGAEASHGPHHLHHPHHPRPGQDRVGKPDL